MTHLLAAADGSLLIRAFERIARDACMPDAPASTVLEAAAMGVALAALGIADRAVDRDRVAARARRVLLGAAALREAALSGGEAAGDAIELAITQARRGIALLSGASTATLDGPPADEPTIEDVARLLRGELDGHAAADVALRLHRSTARDSLAAFLPARDVARPIRLAADSAPAIRDPATGRVLGTTTLGAATLEACVFADGALAIYAEPAIALSLVSIDARIVARAAETAGYLELRLEDDPAAVTLVLGHDERSVRWTLELR